MRIDLHAHSWVSDGTDDPAGLVARAAAAGIDVVALADHDTTAGWAAAIAAGVRLGVEVVPAVEVSTVWREADVHMLAFWPDDTDADFQAMLAEIRRGREQRVPRILARLAEHGVVLTTEQVRTAAAGATSLGRPHVADALVIAGVVADRDQAFDRWLGVGRPGHVSKPAPDLTVAIARTRAAGGVCVLAHPWGRGSRSVLGADDLARLAAVGLVGLEVDHVDHDAAARQTLRTLAHAAGLVVTGGSDYHGTGKAGVELGENTTSEPDYRALQRARVAVR
jgi:3',5'-nucleoside bisphosphate phosphatase